MRLGVQRIFVPALPFAQLQKHTKQADRPTMTAALLGTGRHAWHASPSQSAAALLGQSTKIWKDGPVRFNHRRVPGVRDAATADFTRGSQ